MLCNCLTQGCPVWGYPEQRGHEVGWPSERWMPVPIPAPGHLGEEPACPAQRSNIQPFWGRGSFLPSQMKYMTLLTRLQPPHLDWGGRAAPLGPTGMPLYPPDPLGFPQGLGSQLRKDENSFLPLSLGSASISRNWADEWLAWPLRAKQSNKESCPQGLQPTPCPILSWAVWVVPRVGWGLLPSQPRVASFSIKRSPQKQSPQNNNCEFHKTNNILNRRTPK